jgi:hypothetical protein
MTTENTQNFRPTKIPDMLDVVFSDIAKNTAARKALLDSYQGALASWSNQPIPEPEQFWKQNSTGLLHRIITVASAGTSSQRHILHVIHETEDGAIFSTDLGAFLNGKIEYSIASHNYGEELPEAPEFELTDSFCWEHPELPTEKRFQPLTDEEARKKLAKNPLSLWLVNTTRTKHGVPEILVECVEHQNEHTKPIVLKIPDSWLPIDVGAQVPLEPLKYNTRFLKLIANGHVSIIRKKLAHAVLETDEAKAERERLLGRGATVKIAGAPRDTSINSKAGV